MSRPVVVIPDDYPVLFGSHGQIALEELADAAEIHLHSSRWSDRKELFTRIAAATAIINVRAYTHLDAEALGQAPHLKFITVVGVGVDNIDVQAAAGREILVANTPGVASEAVAELALALAFATARHLPRSDRDVRAGNWTHYPSLELRGKTMGLLGIGAIGARVAVLAQGIGMHVIGWNRSEQNARERAPGVELVSLDDVLRRSDVVSIHVRSTLETAGLVGRREIGLMKPTAILVNTARSVVVDYLALAEAIREGRLAGAGLDVHSVEPLPPEHNLFVDLENVVLTPHSGAVTADANERSVNEAVRNVVAFLNGEPIRIVN